MSIVVNHSFYQYVQVFDQAKSDEDRLGILLTVDDTKIIPVAEIDPGQRPLLPGQTDQLGRLPGVEGERLLGKDVFIGQDGLAVDLKMDVVRGAIVDDLDLGVV